MLKKMVCGLQILLAFILVCTFAAKANPTLVTGIWKNITPPVVQTGNNETCIGQGIAIDPTDPNTIYWGTTPYNSSVGGLFKTTNGGESWQRVAKIKAAWQGAADYLDEPLHIRINPNDHNHLYVGDGVRGSAQGFFISHDGGENFDLPQGFRDCLSREGIDNQDLYDVAVDPTDFNHVLVSYHYRWGWTETKWNTSSGILESNDGGLTWHLGGFVASWGSGHAIKFLYDPAKGIGNASTWLIGTQGNGFWRTSDGGANWKQVTTTNIMHGGGTIYYAQNGTVYASSEGGVLRSTDNGITWANAGYTSSNTCVYGDGSTLYTAPGWSQSAIYVKPENGTGSAWTAFSSQQIGQGPYEMAFDKVNSILYSSSWNAGVWALKVTGSTGSKAFASVKTAEVKAESRGLTINNGKGGVNGYKDITAKTRNANIYDLKGQRIQQSRFGMQAAIISKGR